MQSKYFCFTRFAAHGTLDPDQIYQSLQPLCTYFAFQQEVCPETGQDHIQGYIALKKRSRATTLCRAFPAHYEARRGSHTEASAYAQKEATRKPGCIPRVFGVAPIEPGGRNDLESFRDAIIEGASDWLLLELFPREMAKFPKFLHLVRSSKLSYDVLRDIPPLIPRLGWQFELSQRLEGQPSRRQVHWRWESVGNVGKSYYALHYKPANTFIITGGKHSDIHYSYGYQPYVFFDWARCAESTFPYGLVEQFKNGYFLSAKYESIPKRFPVPHVVVFANFEPDVTQMSLDRWDIEKIE